MRTAISLFALFILLTLPARALAAPVPVVVSIPPQRYFVEKIGGEAVTVTVMTAKGQDPHTYEPAPGQMESAARAEIYFAIGLPFETQWLPKFHSLNPSMDIVNLLGAVPRIQGQPDLALRGALPGKGHPGHHGHEHAHGLETDDPHAWLSPDDMIKTLPLIVAALSKRKPDLAQTFRERGAELRETVAGLDAQIRKALAPVNGRAFLTFHQSWAHYARNFALREVSVELDGREPGPKSMALLMDFAKAGGIRVIVADPMTSKPVVEAIAKNIGATVVHADPLAENWPEALLAFSQNLAAALLGEGAQ